MGIAAAATDFLSVEGKQGKASAQEDKIETYSGENPARTNPLRLQTR